MTLYRRVELDDSTVKYEPVDDVERLEAALRTFAKTLCLPGGPSLAVQNHDPSWEAWKALCDLVAEIKP